MNNVITQPIQKKTTFTIDEATSFWANNSDYYDKFEYAIRGITVIELSEKEKIDYLNKLREIYDKEWASADSPLLKRACKYFYLYCRKYVQDGIKPNKLFENLSIKDIEKLESVITNPYGKLVLNRAKAGWLLEHSHFKILELSSGGIIPI